MKCTTCVKPTAIFLLAMFQMFMLLGCSGNDGSMPFSPSANGASPALSKDSATELSKKKGQSGTLDFLMVAVRDPHENGVTQKWVGPAGGVIKHGDHSVVIPSGALSNWVKIRFSMPKSDTLLFDLQPSDTEFNLPIQLVFEYDNAVLTGVNENKLQLVVLDTAKKEWDSVQTTVLPAVDVVDGLSDHFSRYAIIRN